MQTLSSIVTGDLAEPLSLLGFAVPSLYCLAALFVVFSSSTSRSWLLSRSVTGLAIVIASASLAYQLLKAIVGTNPTDTLGSGFVLLATILGYVITKFSSQYLDGEPGQKLFTLHLLTALAAITLLAIADNLLFIGLCWLVTSINLHHLLTYYPDRPLATLAARKKFVLSRIADILLGVALVLLYSTTGTLQISELSDAYATATTLPAGASLSMVLLVVCVILKSAQLPLHGWLMQVMEAPTPVSALLHAGIVNLGGFVLIKLSVLLTLVPSAQFLLVIVGGGTALLAGLTMTTRTAVKDRLAWSTTSQMGFMLFELGLGLYHLAFLHLIGHSFYKSYSFLSSGEEVSASKKRDMMAPRGGQRPLWEVRGVWLALSGLLSSGLLYGIDLIWAAYLGRHQLPLISLTIVGLGLSPLLWNLRFQNVLPGVRNTGKFLILVHLYLGLHHLSVLTFNAPQVEAPIALTTFALSLIGSMYVLQIFFIVSPDHLKVKKLRSYVASGYNLDVPVTLFTNRIWNRFTGTLTETSTITVPARSTEMKGEVA